MKHNKAIFLFRRDLRLADNKGLNLALKNSKTVIPCFIFDPRQCTKKNRYKSNNALQFMIESLKDLDNSLKTIGSKLYVFYGKPEKILEQLIKEEHCDALFLNRDYTPFSKTRDALIKKKCTALHIPFHEIDDLLLITSPETILTKKGTPFRLFTPFYKHVLAKSIEKPQKLISKNFYKRRVSLIELTIKNELTPKGIMLNHINKTLFIPGGRSQGLVLLKKIKKLKDYKKTKDYPAIPTSFLSAHHKFGTISVRETADEIINQFGKNHELLRQLYWRDFFTYLLWHFPKLLGSPCRKVSWKWQYNKKAFKNWCDGKTGYPFIDIGMNMLNKTGFMPNRMRMVAASYLTKILKIDWRWGERYFAQQLIDYDPAVNNGNWQWVASTGCDAQPPFRKFSPTEQMRKFGNG